MKANKCIHCDNQTFQKDGICVICRIGIARMYTELASVLNKEESRIKLRASKLRHRR
jgi:hypothetical protein